MDDALTLLIVSGSIFVGLLWIVLHYMTKWKTAATLTTGDEALLEELYQLAKRLDERMDTVERLVAADHPEFRPEFRPARPIPDRAADNQSVRPIDRMLGKERTAK